MSITKRVVGYLGADNNAMTVVLDWYEKDQE